MTLMIKNENAWSQLKQEPHASDYSLGGLYFTHTQLSLLGIAHGRLVAVRTRQWRQHPPEPPVIPVPDVLAAGHGVRPGADFDERVEGNVTWDNKQGVVMSISSKPELGNRHVMVPADTHDHQIMQAILAAASVFDLPPHDAVLAIDKLLQKQN